VFIVGNDLITAPVVQSTKVTVVFHVPTIEFAFESALCADIFDAAVNTSIAKAIAASLCIRMFILFLLDF
jgi:hypothetical protein